VSFFYPSVRLNKRGHRLSPVSRMGSYIEINTDAQRFPTRDIGVI
jgi:hypothetical protein